MNALDDKGDWAVKVVDVFGKQVMYLSFPAPKSREKARDAKRAFDSASQLYDVVVERREIE